MMTKNSEVVEKVDLVLIDSPKKDQRIEIGQESIEKLAGSIDELGLMQPILITPRGVRYEVVWGHRRFLAHKFLGKTNILAKIQELTSSEIIIMRATENLFREGITPIEEAYIYQDLRDSEKMTNDQIARRMRKSVGIVRRRLDLLRMPEILQKAIHKKQIRYGVAEDLWALGDEGTISYYLQFAIEHGATNAVVRKWVQDEKDKQRRQATDIGGGVSDIAINENVVTYLACDICKDPVVLGKETVIRACEACTKAVKEAKAKKA